MKSSSNEFLRHLQTERGLSPGTIKAYQLDIESGFIPFLKQRAKFRVEEVIKDDIRAYLDYLTLERANSNAARARKLAAIKSFFNYLVENGGLEVNPAAPIKSSRIPQKEVVYLTDEECICLLDTVARKAKPQARERDMAIVVLFLHTGLRASELTNLELANVDLQRNQIEITRKGNREQYLHLNGETASVLASYVANRPQSQNGRFL